ncbi:MAG: hypothetical protein GY847_18815 [Proteobacteria bacterium]|nr:hypothetical protein [Pseudomonadota bacterium]
MKIDITTRLFVIWISIIVISIIPLHTFAQESPSAEDGDLASIKQEIEQLKADDDELDKQIQELETRNAEQDSENKERIEQLKAEQEEMAFEASMAGLEMELESELYPRFRVFGFFDLAFGKFFYEKNSSFNTFTGSNWSFFQSNFNLYIQSYMTETLSVLGELRFSFLPHGADEEYEYEGMPSEGLPSQGIYGNEYKRTNTRVVDPSSSFAYYPGGITIERIHLTYAPLDWFNVIAGFYPSPYGIWNVDHGSPVVLPVKLPWFIVRQMVPRAQLGVQVCGKLFPTDRLKFDYAITLSNGTPSSLTDMQDLNDNKGVGLRLKLAYLGDKITIAGGAYAYYSRTNDNKKTIHVAGMSDKATDDKPLQVEISDISDTKEINIATDLLIEAFGFRLQSEYVWVYSKQLIPSPISSNFSIFHGVSPFQTILTPSQLGNDVYVLLAYELPLEKWLENLRIIPFFMFEYGLPLDMYKYRGITQYILGLNLKPSPYITLKLEGEIATFHTKSMGKPGKGIIAQLAVSF